MVFEKENSSIHASEHLENEPNIKYPGHRIMAKVMAENLWRSSDENGLLVFCDCEERFTDLERVLEIAKTEIGENNHEEEKTEVQPEAEIRKMAFSALDDFIRHALDDGLLSNKSAYLGIRLNRPTDIVIENEGFTGGYNYDSRDDRSKFPDEARGQKPEIVLTVRGIRQGFINYKKTAIKEKLDLSDDLLLKMAVADMAVHEWAHTLERAIDTKYLAKFRSFPEYSQECWFGALKISQVVTEAASKISASVIDVDDEMAGAVIDTERFATGFGHEAMRIFLEEEGVSNEDIDKFMNSLGKNMKDRLDDFARMRKEIGTEDMRLKFFAIDLREVMRRKGLRFGHIPVLWNMIGHMSPFRKEELEKILKLAMDHANDTEKIHQELLAYKKEMRFSQ